MMESQSAVDGKELKSLLVFLVESAADLVDHLDDANDLTPDADGHAQDVLGDVSGLLVDGLVETRVVVGVVNIESLASLGHPPSDANANRKPKSVKERTL